MVAVGFNPRFGDPIIAGVAERRLNSLDYGIPTAIQSSLRDETNVCDSFPWVETHGYRQMSLRDKQFRSLCDKHFSSVV